MLVSGHLIEASIHPGIEIESKMQLDVRMRVQTFCMSVCKHQWQILHPPTHLQEQFTHIPEMDHCNLASCVVVFHLNDT